MSKYLNEDGLVKLISLIKKADEDVSTTVIAAIDKKIEDAAYILPVAKTDKLGGVIIGDNLSVDDTGKVSVSVVSTFSSTGTAPVNGIAVAAAIDEKITITDDGAGNIVVRKN